MRSLLFTAHAAFTAAAPSMMGSRNSLGITQRAASKKGIVSAAGVVSPFQGQSDVSWSYDWGAKAGSGNGYVPMFHCPADGGDKQGILNLVTTGQTKYVLGYNECDHLVKDGGCAVRPEVAAQQWAADMWQVILSGGQLVCPAVSSYDTAVGLAGFQSGLTWLEAFVGASPDGTPGFFQCAAQAIHWYGVDGLDGRSQGDLFLKYVQDAHIRIDGIFRKPMPLWITEFAPLPINNPAVMGEFLAYVVPQLDQMDFVERYSPFQTT